MFTGLVETRSSVRRRLPQGTGVALWVAVPEGWEPSVGASVSVSGACLSVADLGAAEMLFEASQETLARTWLGSLAPGDDVNLERAMRLSDRLDGHLVTGHIDGLGKVVAVSDSGDGGRRITFEVREESERWLVEKGSIAVDGVSLTVVEPRGRLFDAAVIPITLAKTTLGRAAPGRPVNLEFDLLGKWIDRLLAARA